MAAPRKIPEHVLFPSQRYQSNPQATSKLRKFGLKTFLITVVLFILFILVFLYTKVSAKTSIRYETIRLFVPEKYVQTFESLKNISFNNTNRFEFVNNPNKADVIVEISKEIPNEEIPYLLIDLFPTVDFYTPLISVPSDAEFYIDKDLSTLIPILQALYGITAMPIEVAENTPPNAVVLLPFTKLTPSRRVLIKNNRYALDELRRKSTKLEGAYRIVIQLKTPEGLFRKPDKKKLSVTYNIIRKRLFATDDQNLSVSKITLTGVTAITRGLLKRLHATKDYSWLIEGIKTTVADADLVHTSNEVSFKPNCKSYSGMLFCSDETHFQILQDLNINLIELTGNHNNDFGAKWNAYSIEKLYKPNQINYFGGGVNIEDARKPFITTLPDGTKVAFLGYNYFDAKVINNPTPLASETKAGANPYDERLVQKDIEQLRQQGIDFIFVHLQFQECYAYPSQRGIRYTPCYRPLPSQVRIFNQLIEYGANFVVGTQAHQPQQIKLINESKTIFYGLGNFLFDQIQWIGTREGLIISLYFSEGRLIQIRLIPTWQETDYSIRLMTDQEAEQFLKYILIPPKSKN